MLISARSGSPDLKENDPDAGQKPQYRQLAKVVRLGAPPFPLIAAAVIISLLEIGSTLAFPVLTKELIDGMASIEMTPEGLVSDTRIQLLVAVLIVGAGAGAVASYLLAKAGLALSARLKSRLIDKMLKLPVAYFDRRQSGEHASRITKDVEVVATLITADVQHLVGGALLLVGSAIVLSLLDWQLTLTVFGVILVAFLLMAPILAGLSQITLRLNNRNAALTGLLARIFSEIRLVKAFTAEEVELARGEQEIAALRHHGLKAAAVQASLQPMVSLALTLAVLVIFTYGGARVAAGTLSAGTLTAFVLYIFNIVAPLIQLSMFFAHLQEAKGASLEIHSILTSSEEEASPRAVYPVPVRTAAAEDLSFDKVELAYGGDDRPQLRLESLIIPAATSVAIVGPSGAGKTSLFSLLQRFYAPTGGRISWGGTDVRHFPIHQWRQMLGYVPQSPTLIAGTVRDNITYGLSGEIDPKLVEVAAEEAQCTDFIAALPNGLESQVGDGGVLLSGGQRQRIAIARMFLRDPALLLLDEATSSLDGESEALVLQALRKLMQGRTSMVITHRWHILSHVDHIAVIEDGELRDFGTAAAILENSPYCRRILAQSMVRSDEMFANTGSIKAYGNTRSSSG